MIRRANCPDTGALVSFLYDELDGSEGFDRRAIQRHLEGCERCAAEMASLGGVRQTLREWNAPEMMLGFRVVQEAPAGAGWLSRFAAAWRIPSWAMPAVPLAAAAVLVLGAALGLARLDVQYDANGFRLRTGWGQSNPAGAVNASAVTPAPVTPAIGPQVAPVGLGAPPASATANAAAPWRAELTALERQLRQEMLAIRRGGSGGDAVVTAASHVEGDPSTPSNLTQAEQAFARRVQQMIDQSEVRQQQNLALRIAEVSREFDVQRRTDLVRIEQDFGRLANQREQDAQQQRLLLNAIRVSQQQP
jgi:hypothetical protein